MHARNVSSTSTAYGVLGLYIDDDSEKLVQLQQKIRDQMQGPLLNDRDIYGFGVATTGVSKEEYMQWWIQYEPYLERRQRKWEKLLKKNGCYIGDDDVVWPLRSAEVVRFVRKGFPPKWRGSAWFTYSGAKERMAKNVGLYGELVGKTGLYTEAIAKDLGRTFPDNAYFTGENGKVMQDGMARVLKAFSVYRADIGYCQSLNFICGLLLLFLNEEKAFWVLVVVAEKILPNVHLTTLAGVTAHQHALLNALKERLPTVWKIIVENSDNDGLPTLTVATTGWFMSLFIGTLPTEAVLRVWDVLFYEPPVFVFQTALALFALLEPDLKKCKTLPELFQTVQNTPRRVVNVNLFIAECCRIRVSQQECQRWFSNAPTSSDDISSDGLRKLKTAYWNAGLNRRVKKITKK